MRPITLGLIALLAPALAWGDDITFKDPRGDDKGPGTYVYPTNAVYKSGSFDILEVKLKDAGADVEVSVTVAAKIEDPWDSKKWGGNGFSLQMGFLFIDTDRKAGSGFDEGLPGLNVRFPNDARWDKVVLLSPQGKTRLEAEIGSKAAKMKSAIVIPTTTRAQGATLVAKLPKSALGGAPSKTWAFQLIMQSNEGFPDKKDFLTRKVNEVKGEHRFGGGHDYDCDPHAIDLLAGEGKGAAGEAQAQYTALKAHTCDDNNPDGGTRATVPMIVPK